MQKEASHNNSSRPSQAQGRAKFSVGNAAPRDLAEIVSIDAAQWGHWANNLPLYRQLLDVFPSCIKVARGQDDSIMGFGVGLANVLTRQGLILSVDIAERYRGCGAGREITLALLEDLRQQGCQSAMAMIAPKNTASIRLFQSIGFEQESIEEDYFGQGQTWIRFCCGALNTELGNKKGIHEGIHCILASGTEEL